MKYLYLIIIIFSITNSKSLSQDTLNINPNGYNILYYPNGKVLSEGFLKNGKPEGYWKTYYTTGIIKSEGNRKNYLLDSLWIFYNSTGDTTIKINYLMGRRNGYYYEYVTDRSRPEFIGTIKSKELYVNDIKEGRSFYFYNNGQIWEIVSYKNDKKSGESVEYDEDGRIITLKQYNKGSLVERRKINRYNEKNQKDGVWLEFYEGTKVEKEVNYKDGLFHGYYKEYNENGILTLTLLYDNGILVKNENNVDKEIVVKQKFDDEGNIIESGPFIDDIPVGIHKTFDSKGEIIGSKIYDDTGILLSTGIIDKEGKREGKWKDFYDTGNIKATGSYKNNKREGKWTFYFLNGSIEQEGYYRNGLEDGKWVRYYGNGNIFIEESYFNGKKDGFYTEYEEEGTIITEGNFLEGEKEGKWILEINDLRAEGEFITGLRDGRWRYYYNDGTILYEGIYIQGNPDGKHKYYYPNGQIKEEQYYTSGIANKNWKRYDEEGNLVVTISYQDGKEYRINGVRIDLPDDNTKIIR